MGTHALPVDLLDNYFVERGGVKPHLGPWPLTCNLLAYRGGGGVTLLRPCVSPGACPQGHVPRGVSPGACPQGRVHRACPQGVSPGACPQGRTGARRGIASKTPGKCLFLTVDPFVTCIHS